MTAVLHGKVNTGDVYIDDLVVFLDVVFIMGECTVKLVHLRDRHQEMNSMLPRSTPANEFKCETSSGHFVMR